MTRAPAAAVIALGLLALAIVAGLVIVGFFAFLR